MVHLLFLLYIQLSMFLCGGSSEFMKVKFVFYFYKLKCRVIFQPHSQ